MVDDEDNNNTKFVEMEGHEAVLMYDNGLVHDNTLETEPSTDKEEGDFRRNSSSINRKYGDNSKYLKTNDDGTSTQQEEEDNSKDQLTMETKFSPLRVVVVDTTVNSKNHDNNNGDNKEYVYRQRQEENEEADEASPISHYHVEGEEEGNEPWRKADQARRLLKAALLLEQNLATALQTQKNELLPNESCCNDESSARGDEGATYDDSIVYSSSCHEGIESNSYNEKERAEMKALAFEYVETARRLAERGQLAATTSTVMNKNNNSACFVTSTTDDDNNNNGEDYETTVSTRKEKGKEAATTEVMRLLFGSSGDKNNNAAGMKLNKHDLDLYQQHAKGAFHHLDMILQLPINVAASAAADDDVSNVHDGLTSYSSLGFDNTFQDHNSTEPKSIHDGDDEVVVVVGDGDNVDDDHGEDTYSISSLNEILDDRSGGGHNSFGGSNADASSSKDVEEKIRTGAARTVVVDDKKSVDDSDNDNDNDNDDDNNNKEKQKEIVEGYCSKSGDDKSTICPNTTIGSTMTVNPPSVLPPPIEVEEQHHGQLKGQRSSSSSRSSKIIIGRSLSRLKLLSCTVGKKKVIRFG